MLRLTFCLIGFVSLNSLITVRSSTRTTYFTSCGIATSSTRQADTSEECLAPPSSHCANCSWSAWVHYWKITWGDGSTQNVDVGAHGDCTPPATIFNDPGKCHPTFNAPTFAYSTQNHITTTTASIVSVNNDLDSSESCSGTGTAHVVTASNM